MMLTDMAPEAERILAAVYRQMPPWKKIQQVDEAYSVARDLHAAGCRLRNPASTDIDIRRAWAIMSLGPGPWIDRMEFKTMNSSEEQFRSIRFAVAILDDLNIRHAIGGSYASSLHGYSRFTRDADIAVESFRGKERLFAGRFPKEDWYIDLGMIQDAISRRASFNVIDLRTAFKIDFFIQKDRDYDREFLARRVKAKLFNTHEEEFGVIAAEDSVLLKLEWFRLGGETSDRQWNDVLAVLRTQGDAIDTAYLEKWAAEIGVADLVARARAESA